MIQDDTVKLLKECNAGIKMGVDSIDDVIDKVESTNMQQLLNACKDEHQKLGSETHALLNEYHDSGKNPNIMAKSMSWMKTNTMLSWDRTDSRIADLMTDGCNMGVKSLNKYLNQYEAAEERVKDITKRLIALEENLAVDLRPYL